MSESLRPTALSHSRTSRKCGHDIICDVMGSLKCEWSWILTRSWRQCEVRRVPAPLFCGQCGGTRLRYCCPVLLRWNTKLTLPELGIGSRPDARNGLCAF